MEFMPVDVTRLFESDLFALSTGDEFKAAWALWGKSWLQVPAASLPNDERILAHMSGDRSAWPVVREMALRGWVLCADGRYYHPVVAEKALDAWARRGDFRQRKGSQSERQQRWRDRLRVLSQRLRDAGHHVPEHVTMEALIKLCGKHDISTTTDALTSTGVENVDAPASTVDREKTGKTGDRGQGTGDRGQSKKNPSGSAARRAARLPDDWSLPPEWRSWAVTDHGMAPETVIFEAEKFADYWRAKPGKDAEKLDWLATWRNWCRNAGGTRSRAAGDTSNMIGGVRLSSPC
jgi:hypothetical protein